MTQEFDVAIVGGGLVGASLALALADTPLRVALIEAAPAPSTAPSWDERCIALNDATHRIFSAYGVWPELAADAAPITSTHISERGRFGSARFSAAEAGLEALGYNVPLRAIGAALMRKLAEVSNVTLLCPARVTAVAVESDGAVLSLEGAPFTQLRARLIAAADGAQSPVRAMFGIETEVRDYEQQAIVTAVQLTRPHDGIAYERFTPQGPFALIPKPGRAMSLVWTTPTPRVEDRLSWSDERFLAEAQSVFGDRLGRFAELSARRAYPLARVLSKRLTAARTVFIGNAAQALHPVAAQGFNLGLRDVATLAELLRDAPDPGATDVLDRYEAARHNDRDRVAGLTDLMVRAFSNRLPVLSQTRHLGLVALELAKPLRGAVLRQHLGHLGLPASLRPGTAPGGEAGR